MGESQKEAAGFPDKSCTRTQRPGTMQSLASTFQEGPHHLQLSSFCGCSASQRQVPSHGPNATTRSAEIAAAAQFSSIASRSLAAAGVLAAVQNGPLAGGGVLAHGIWHGRYLDAFSEFEALSLCCCGIGRTRAPPSVLSRLFFQRCGFGL